MGVTEEAIMVCMLALQFGASKPLLKSAMIRQGFKEEKANLIIRWAEMNLQGNTNGTKTSEPVL